MPEPLTQCPQCGSPLRMYGQSVWEVDSQGVPQEPPYIREGNRTLDCTQCTWSTGIFVISNGKVCLEYSTDAE